MQRNTYRHSGFLQVWARANLSYQLPAQRWGFLVFIPKQLVGFLSLSGSNPAAITISQLHASRGLKTVKFLVG